MPEDTQPQPEPAARPAPHDPDDAHKAVATALGASAVMTAE